MILNSIKILIKFKWDYIINLSETDYPIKSLVSLEDYLKKFKNKNFLKFHGQNNDIFIRKQGLEVLFLQCENRMWRLNKKRNLIKQIEFTGGSDWFSLHFTFANYLVNNIFNNTNNLINYSINKTTIEFNDQQFVNNLRIFFNYTLLPAESFFHTVLRNSEYCTKFINNNLRLTNWKRKIGCKCQYRHVVDFCGCSPNVYLETDLQKLKSTFNKPLFFARKFDPLIDHNIINQIELSYNPKSIELINYNKYWHVEYNYKYDNSNDRNLIRSTFTYLSTLALNELFLKYSNYFRSTFNYLDRIKILEINTFLNNGKYIGTQTVLNFTYINRFKLINLKLEFLVSSNHILKSYNDIENNLPIKLVYLKVCTNYDIKEDLFRNFGCLINTDSQLIVQHKWLNLNKLIKNYTINFIWINLNKQIILKDTIILSNINNKNEMITSFNFKSNKLNKLIKPGIWRLIISVIQNSTEINLQEQEDDILKLKLGNLNKIFKKLILNNKIIGETSFLVLDNQMNQIYNYSFNQIMDQLKQFWSLKDVCISSDQKYFNELINLISIEKLNLTIKNCLNTSWSSNLFDPKSIFVN